MRIGILLLVSAACGFSQPVLTPSVTAGVPITDTFGTFQPSGSTGGYAAQSPTRRYVAGGALALDLSPRLSLKAGVLFRPFGYDYNYVPIKFCPCFMHVRGTGSSWEVPMLAKWRLLRRPVTPFAELGGTLRAATNLDETAVLYNLGQPPAATTNPRILKSSIAIAPTVAAGVELRAHRVTFAPEVRYTRWLSDTLGTFGDPIRWNWQRVDFLLDIGLPLGRR